LAIVGYARKEIALELHGNHLNICKFGSISDPGYQAVFGVLQDYVRVVTLLDGLLPSVEGYDS